LTVINLRGEKEMDDLGLLATLVEKGDHLGTAKLTRELLERGIDPNQILLEGLQKGMLSLGERFKCNEAFIPEVLLSSRAMKTGIEALKPFWAPTGPRVKVVLGTVKNDLHDIGKNMVGMMLESLGFKLIDLGVNVHEEKFLSVIREEEAPLLAMSSLLSTTMPELNRVIQLLKKKGMRDNVKVLVGGAPVTEEYAIHIGADGYAPDAVRGAEKAIELTGVKK
jgi:5-methyltetrahydrofolate--homocysteine methyltransferase